MALEGTSMRVFSRIGIVLLPDSDCVINGAGEEDSRSRRGACVKSNHADFVGMANEQSVYATLGVLLKNC